MDFLGFIQPYSSPERLPMVSSRQPFKECLRGHSRRAVLLLVTANWLFACSHAAGEATGQLCEASCQKQLSPICAADGHTYATACLATCQGVAISHDGPCQGETLLHPDNIHAAAAHGSSAKGAQALTQHVVDKFRSEGYNYAGQVQLLQPKQAGKGKGPRSKAGQTTDAKRGNTQSHASNQRQPQEEPARSASSDDSTQLRLTKVTRDGHVYVKVLDVQQAQTERLQRRSLLQASAGSSASLDLAMPGQAAMSPLHMKVLEAASGMTSEAATAAARTGEDAGIVGGGVDSGPSASAAPAGPEQADVKQHRRELGILGGSDERIDCPRIPTYPLSTTGQLVFEEGTEATLCTGTMIGTNAVLTAAHCIFNRLAKTFYKAVGFSPGRFYSNTTGAVRDMYGLYNWTTINYLSAYTSDYDKDPNTIDIAVLILDTAVGFETGWLGVWEPCTGNYSTPYLARTAGYPTDRPLGSCVTTTCTITQYDCTAAYQYHTCDTVAGQSGSAMWMTAMKNGTSEYLPYVRVVHNVEWIATNVTSGANSGVSITPSHYAALESWTSGSFTVDPSSMPTPPDGVSAPVNLTQFEPFKGWGPGRARLQKVVAQGL